MLTIGYWLAVRQHLCIFPFNVINAWKERKKGDSFCQVDTANDDSFFFKN